MRAYAMTELSSIWARQATRRVRKTRDLSMMGNRDVGWRRWMCVGRDWYGLRDDKD